MKISEVMIPDVTVAKPETSFKEAIDLLVSRDVSGLPVVNDAGVLIGIVTEADLMSKEAFGEKARPIEVVLGFLTGERSWALKARGLTVGEIMTVPLVTAKPHEDVRVVARRMLVNKVKRVPVIDRDRHVVGIVTRHDLLGIYRRDDAEIEAGIKARLADPDDAPAEHTVTASVSDGVVTLTGQVRWHQDIPLIVALANHEPGVVTVVNNVTFAERGST